MVDRARDRVRAWLEARMPDGRRAHQEGIVRAARELAGRFGVDPERSELAAWLHDAGKYLPLDEQRTRLAGRGEVAGVVLDADELAADELLHAPVSAVLGTDEFGIADRGVLRAARLHTTGAPGMDLIEQVIYLADYLEPSRTHVRPAVRNAARVDLALSVRLAAAHKIEYVRSLGKRPHPRSLALVATPAG